jgi:hypothetical protein
MCCVRISEQTAIISLYSINWLVFITETECVYCAVRAEYIQGAALEYEEFQTAVVIGWVRYKKQNIAMYQQ